MILNIYGRKTINKTKPEYQFNYIFIGDRQKPIVFWLHGFMGNCDDFMSAIEYLPDYCCLVVDLPGHGRTEVAEDNNYQMPQVAQALIKLLNQLKIEQCILVGYSMGGRIALYLACYFPEYFRGVVLESASPGLPTLSERKRRIAKDLQLARRLTSEDFHDFLQDWYLNPLFDSFREHSCYDSAIERRLNNDPCKLAKSLLQMGLGKQPNLTVKIRRLKLPLLLIVGELDLKFIETNRQIARSCSSATLSIVDRSGHNVHLEEPVKFSQLLQSFFIRLLVTAEPNHLLSINKRVKKSL